MVQQQLLHFATTQPSHVSNVCAPLRDFRHQFLTFVKNRGFPMRVIVKEVAVLALVALVAQVGVFFLYAATSCQLPSLSLSSATTGGANELRVLVLSDVHILGKRRRSWLERAWIDWQVRALLASCELVVV